MNSIDLTLEPLGVRCLTGQHVAVSVTIVNPDGSAYELADLDTHVEGDVPWIATIVDNTVQLVLTSAQTSTLSPVAGMPFCVWVQSEDLAVRFPVARGSLSVAAAT